MQVYKGTDALSDFRKAKLLARLQNIDETITDVEAEYIHLVDVVQKLSATEEKQLIELLTYGITWTGSRDGSLYLAVPRPGTISPWSSKATDIVHSSGITTIKRIERGVAYYLKGASSSSRSIGEALHDRMTEVVLQSIESAKVLFEESSPPVFKTIKILENGKAALKTANNELGLALADDEIDYLNDAYSAIKRNPTDIELMMFAQVNSEHCRHKVFNADWVIDGQTQPKSLFKMIRNTYEKGGEDVLSAYSDNAAVLRGPDAKRFFVIPSPVTTVTKKSRYTQL